MRILFFLQCMGVGGAERQASMLTDHLRRRGHEVAVEALHTLDPDWRCLWDPASPEPAIHYSERPAHALSGLVQFFAAMRRLRRSLREARPRVLYATQGATCLFLAWLATRGLSEVKLVWSLRGLASEGGWEVSVLSRLSSWVSPTVGLIIASSEAVCLPRRRGRGDTGSCIVIHDGIDVELFRPDRVAGEMVRSEWGIAPSLELIGLVARLDPAKGHADFLRAAARLARLREDVLFVCVGHGPRELFEDLRLRGWELGLEERVIWAGGRSDMPAVYNALDVLCSPSHSEGFNLSIGEAMACGVPCVATSTADPAGMMDTSCVVVPAHDPRALADGLSAMLDRLADVDPVALRRRITRDFSAAKMLDAAEAALTAVR